MRAFFLIQRPNGLSFVSKNCSQLFYHKPCKIYSTQSMPEKSPISLLESVFKGNSLTSSDENPTEVIKLVENYYLQSLVQFYRQNGHLLAQIDPLHHEIPRSFVPKNTLLEFIPEFVKENKSMPIQWLIQGFPSNATTVTDLINFLEQTYTGPIGIEFQHIENVYERNWIANTLESSTSTATFSLLEKETFLKLLTQSQVLDGFLHRKFPQLKRYGLEGAEGMMVAMHRLLEQAALKTSIENVVVCMPHRGRLNLLTGLLALPPRAIFHKIKGNNELPTGHGEFKGSSDVLSHLGQSVDLEFSGKSIHCTLLHNPSHLEAVNPVAVGKTRAKAFETQQNQASDQAFFDSVLCVQLHGDSAFAGQGIVAETFQMANLEDFTVGGSLHLIVNNQLGFTCSSKNARSSRYASDLAKMIGCPIFHVNSEHPEAIAKAIDLALKYRKTFKKDIVVDLIGFRKYGHNELDEPSFTQPLMYGKIRQKDSIGYIYESKLNEENLKTSVSVMDIEKSYVDYLEKEFDAATTYEPSEEMTLQGKWKGLTFKQNEPVDTGVEMTLLQLVGKASVAIPEKFNIHPRLLKHHIEPRLQSLLDKKSLIDWATAEALAFGSLLINEKVSIRLSGQDSGRGTFSHRHVQLTDQETQEIYIPLNHIAKDNEKDSENGKIIPVNTYLSELAVLGFEYGYSLESPKNLVIWEAQFGDFFNGAQTIIDAFVTSGEDKWFRQSGLVMLLPHGYDGAGPEHSSARLERFLQLSNEPLIETKDFLPKHSNIDVVNPTTPAQYFHLLRRQIVRNFRKPLILMAPKTLLRHPLATSSLDQFTEGTAFQPILDDSKFVGNKQRKVKKLLIVSGKLYYDLLKERAQLQLDSTVAIICMEQLAPFPWKELKRVLSKYTNLQRVVWCQEEPRNMGAFSFVSPRIQQLLPSHLGLYYAGRIEMAAPATGVSAIYKKEQEALIKLPFDMVNS